jgi:hypothetical protein
VRVHRLAGGRISLEVVRFAPTNSDDPFYQGRNYRSWQDWNYQIYRLVVQEGRSLPEAYGEMRAIDRETVLQMMRWAAVSSV